MRYEDNGNYPQGFNERDAFSDPIRQRRAKQTKKPSPITDAEYLRQQEAFKRVDDFDNNWHK